MAKNDSILIDGIIAQRAADKKPSDDIGEVFEYFSFGQILKQYVFGKTLAGTFVLARSANGSRTLNTPQRFYGITQTGFLDLRGFADMVRSLPDGISELMCHPGYVDEDLTRTPTRLHVQRERELQLLTGREVRGLLENAGVELASYRHLGDFRFNG